MKTPKIIHQIWSGIDEPLPDYFEILNRTWRDNYPEWQYILWDNEMMTNFVQQNYPQYWDYYSRFPYNVQRWDAIRYLILYKIGGMYVDCDYESLEPFDDLVEEQSCCFALEPQSHCDIFNRQIMFNNALMVTAPGHSFMKIVIEAVFTDNNLSYDPANKQICVLNTTGPWMLIDLYEKLLESEKKNVYLIPAKYVTPFDVMQARAVRRGDNNNSLEKCLYEARAVHYFFNSWLIADN